MTLTVMVCDKQRQAGELQGLEAHKLTPSWRDSGGGAGIEVGNLGLVWDLNTEKLFLLLLTTMDYTDISDQTPC